MLNKQTSSPSLEGDNISMMFTAHFPKVGKHRNEFILNKNISLCRFYIVNLDITKESSLQLEVV